MFEVAVPKPEEQHLKNWKYKLVEQKVSDPVTGEKWAVTHKVYLTIETDGEPVYEKGGEPVWGLGCPGNCGRFWQFEPDEQYEIEEADSDGVKRKWARAPPTAHWKPADVSAYQGVDSEGNKTEGYLNFRADPKDPSKVKIFSCDRCGVEIRLVKK